MTCSSSGAAMDWWGSTGSTAAHSRTLYLPGDIGVMPGNLDVPRILSSPILKTCSYFVSVYAVCMHACLSHVGTFGVCMYACLLVCRYMCLWVGCMRMCTCVFVCLQAGVVCQESSI